MKKRMKNLIENFTYDKRQARRTKKHEEIIQRYERMTSDELEMHTVEIITKYEYRRNVTVALFGAILLATVMDVGKYFFQTAREFLVIVYQNTGDIEMAAKTSLITFFAIFLSILVVILGIILSLLLEMRSIISEKVMLEKFMERERIKKDIRKNA